MSEAGPAIQFDNTFALQMEGFYAPAEGEAAPSPAIICVNDALATQLGIDPAQLRSEQGAAVLSGSALPEGAAPLAQAYAGHQFGGFSHQLGDGRALLLGETLDASGARYDIQLKGSGRTPFSRGGDGKAAIGPVLREYLISEAMHALGIPTTRSLAAVSTGETIYRDQPKPGAVLTRVAASHLRVGTFQFFAARGEWDKVAQLTDYVIARHFPDLAGAENKYHALLSRVAEQQAMLIAHWMRVGFVHGVMNTDNMTISGETIDYGPCAFLDAYSPTAVFSSIDEHGRYAFANQPIIGRWNLARLAEALMPLIDADDEDNAHALASEVINDFAERYTAIFTQFIGQKLGLETVQEGDGGLINDLFAALDGQGVDFTGFFRSLADVAAGDASTVESLFDDPALFKAWLPAWQQRMASDGISAEQRIAAMNAVNPIYIPRNHKVEEALQAAEQGDFAPFEKLVAVLSDPFTRREGLGDYAVPAPEGFGPYKTFCGT